MKIQVQVGQEVAIQRYTGGYWFGVVTKVTPTGRSTVKPANSVFNGTGSEREFQFDNEGVAKASYEGESHYRRDRLQVDVAAVREQIGARQRREDAAQAINAITKANERPARHEWSKETLQIRVDELEGLIAAARAAVEAV